MKKTLFIILAIFYFSCVNSQNLTVDELISLRNKDLASVEEFATNKGWSFLLAEEPKDGTLGKIVFTLNKSDYDDKAECFLTYLYSDSRSRIDIQFIKTEKYNNYIARVKALGMKLINTKVENGVIIKTYQGATTTIQIDVSSKSSYSGSKTSYHFFIMTNEDYEKNFSE